MGVQLLISLRGLGAAPLSLATALEEVQPVQLPGHPRGTVQTHARKTFCEKFKAGYSSEGRALVQAFRLGLWWVGRKGLEEQAVTGKVKGPTLQGHTLPGWVP